MKSLNQVILESSINDENINEGKGGSLSQNEIDMLKDIFGNKFVVGKRGSAEVIAEEGVRKYNFGRNDKGYWIRGTHRNEYKKYCREKGWDQYRLNYNRETGEYTFETFDKMLTYFLAFWVKKYSK